MSNWFINSIHAVGDWFKSVFKGILGQAEASAVEFLKEFAKTDLGNLAIDAVSVAENLVNATGDEKRAAAIAQLLTDATKAGIDLVSFGKSEINFIIETALQAFKAKLASVPTSVETTIK